MRADPNLYASVGVSLQQSEATLQKALSQLSSGKRVSVPSDDPIAFAMSTQNLSRSARIDQYTQSNGALQTQAQQADSALSSVVSSLTQALSLGTEGGSPGISSAQRSTLAGQVQSVLQNVMAQANTQSDGQALFAGTASTTIPFEVDPAQPNTVLYTGNQTSNQTSIGDNNTVTTGVPGDAIFQNPAGDVFGSLQQLVAALQNGSSTDLGDATSAVSAAIAHIGQVRAVYSGTVNQITSQDAVFAQETVSLSTQTASLTSVDLASAATALTQAQTAHSAVLAAAAKILPESLLNYLRN